MTNVLPFPSERRVRDAPTHLVLIGEGERYRCDSTARVYKSVDGGETWTELAAPINARLARAGR